ncbi:farnesol dehydrogenase-like [Ischnura elegans]|uniref:farnesol dehydrogenase-like n=1 Tax=Ischnura elegans TaxID=197161 RepID=UPI001ED8B851|nr:farnesol dehydrogenase-like [Ischnura elegans]XP_046394870.1 farnesol dehydrogenase-like [Ischnura elegans]XP_046394871.1 farnesol dehydrogenase-like [Ischnura elegans]
MERWVGKIAMVTGASSGIGAAITKELVREGMVVLGVARRVEKVKELESSLKGAKGKLHAVKGDVGDEADVSRVFEWVRSTFGKIHVLINNAGVNRNIPLTGGANMADMRALFQTNVFGLLYCTDAAVTLMKDSGVDDGHIFHMNSIAGHQVVPMPGNYVYTASKFAVTALTEGLRRELRDAHMKTRVTCISPGFVKTDIAAAGHMDEVAKLMDTMPALDPSEIASAVTYALSAPPSVQVHDVVIKPLGEMI